jgi:DNA-binding MarR family transcriptional regulator
VVTVRTVGRSPDEVLGPLPLVAIPGYLIRRSQRVHGRLWAELVSGDLTGPQYAVLSVLGRVAEAEQQWVADLASLDKSSAADVVARLIRKSWITRARDPEDSRRYLLALTSAAALALPTITPQSAAVQEAMLAPVAASRRRGFEEELAAVARLGECEPYVPREVELPVLALTAPGHLIRCAQQVHTALWGEALGGALTGPQYAVLHAVAANPGINQRRLGELAALDKSTAADIIGRLVAKGWLDRERDPEDGRGRILRLTEEAPARLAGVHPLVEQVQQRLLEVLPGERRAAFVHDLARVAFEGDPPAEARGSSGGTEPRLSEALAYEVGE